MKAAPLTPVWADLARAVALVQQRLNAKTPGKDDDAARIKSAAPEEEVPVARRQPRRA